MCEFSTWVLKLRSMSSCFVALPMNFQLNVASAMLELELWVEYRKSEEKIVLKRGCWCYTSGLQCLAA